MKLREYEAKQILAGHGIPIPAGFLIRSPDELADRMTELSDRVVLKAQVDVGGRGKAGGVLFADKGSCTGVARELFSRSIKGIPVTEVLVEQALEIERELYTAVLIDRSSKEALVLFTTEGGVDIEETARNHPERIRKARIPLIMERVPSFMLRDLTQGVGKEIGPVIQNLYSAFIRHDAVLAEINPLVVTPAGVFAADAKLIIDDNALTRQGIVVNRDLTERERVAQSHGFSYVELEGTIGVIGNGAGLTMATLDLIGHYHGSAANFLDVGGGADKDRVREAVRLVATKPGVRVIVVNLLGGITRCDEVARGIVDAGIPQKVIVRLAGTNEQEGKAILDGGGYVMVDTMEDAVRTAVEMAS